MMYAIFQDTSENLDLAERLKRESPAIAASIARECLSLVASSKDDAFKRRSLLRIRAILDATSRRTR
jgi:hypothetical protein